MKQLAAHVVVLLVASHAVAEPVAGQKGMVSSAHPDATAAGVEVLRLGGNAADAAAAVAFALSVVEPYSSGIGGGGFALTRFGKELEFLDFREVAPLKASRDMYIRDGEAKKELSRDGILSVAVPGAVAGYLHLQEKYGKLKRKQVLGPALRLADKGFLATARFVGYTEWRLEVLRKDPEASRIFLLKDKDGVYQVPPVGHRIVQKDKAWTLRQLIRHGAKAFYTGAVAKRLVKDMKDRGGIMTQEDLTKYKVRYRKPLVGSYRGHAVASSPPPSAGGQVVLTILNVLESFPAEDAPKLWHSEEYLHRYIEASKRAYADRYLLGDPDFVGDPTPRLVTKERAKALLAGIGHYAAPATAVPAGQGAELNAVTHQASIGPTGDDTTHLSVLDKEGNAVSMTTTVNYGWGSGVVAKGTGVVWNDEMDDFAIAPGVPNAYGVVGSEANAVAPGKVPLSSMSPTIVFQGPTTDSPVRLVVGSPGGPRIPTTVIQAIFNHIEFGAPIDKALGMGRMHHQHLPDKVFLEPYTLDPATKAALEARGHVFDEGRTWSNATAIAVDPRTGLRTAAADPRGVGTAMAE